MAFPKKKYGDDEARWDASVRRDPRAVGHFLIGVRTTRIYCLPTCPARPKRENVFFVQTPEEAVAAGCRPCLRCKPSAAQGLLPERRDGCQKRV